MQTRSAAQSAQAAAQGAPHGGAPAASLDGSFPSPLVPTTPSSTHGGSAGLPGMTTNTPEQGALPSPAQQQLPSATLIQGILGLSPSADGTRTLPSAVQTLPSTTAGLPMPQMGAAPSLPGPLMLQQRAGAPTSAPYTAMWPQQMHQMHSLPTPSHAPHQPAYNASLGLQQLPQPQWATRYPLP